MSAEIAAAASSLGGQILNVFSQSQTNRDNKDLTREQMAFQERMSSTAHQRETKDLLAAGLNPNMSAKSSGASTPGGAAATMVAPQIQMPDLMAYGISLKQLDQKQQEINNQTAMTISNVDSNKQNITSSRQKMITEQLSQQLLQRGQVKAKLEGEAAEVLDKAIDWIKGSVRKPKQPTQWNKN